MMHLAMMRHIVFHYITVFNITFMSLNLYYFLVANSRSLESRIIKKREQNCPRR